VHSCSICAITWTLARTHPSRSTVRRRTRTSRCSRGVVYNFFSAQIEHVTVMARLGAPWARCWQGFLYWVVFEFEELNMLKPIRKRVSQWHVRDTHVQRASGQRAGGQRAGGQRCTYMCMCSEQAGGQRARERESEATSERGKRARERERCTHMCSAIPARCALYPDSTVVSRYVPDTWCSRRSRHVGVFAGTARNADDLPTAMLTRQTAMPGVVQTAKSWHF